MSRPIKKRKDKEDRRQQRLRRLGTENPSCAVCGESDSSALDLHHIAGEAHHDDVAILCATHHRMLTDMQLDHDLTQATLPKTDLAKIGYYLLGLADLLEKMVPTFREFGARLITESRRGR
jgi:hypothetical protein